MPKKGRASVGKMDKFRFSTTFPLVKRGLVKVSVGEIDLFPFRLPRITARLSRNFAFGHHLQVAFLRNEK